MLHGPPYYMVLSDTVSLSLGPTGGALNQLWRQRYAPPPPTLGFHFVVVAAVVRVCDCVQETSKSEQKEGVPDGCELQCG